MREKFLTGVLLSSLVGSSALAKGGANQDAFLMSQENKPLAATAEALRERGARVEHAEERLGVPSFLWKEGASARDSALMTLKPEQAAREHLRAYADLYRLSGKDAMGAELRNLHSPKQGAVVARFGQAVDGIEVFRNELKVVMNADNELVAISGYLAPSQAVEKARLTASRDFRLSAEDAIASAFRDMTGVAISPRSLVAGKVQGAYTSFGFDAGSSRMLTWHMEEPARARKVFFTLPDRLEPAWYVEVNAGPKASQESAFYSFVVSATDGALLLRNDLSSHADFSYRVWADPSLKIPHDGPQGTGASPHPTGTPNRFQAPFTPPSFVTLQNYPFSRNDPWLPDNATQTTGNNVDAYVDRAAPDGFQAETDLRASITAPGVFDYTYDTALAPDANETQQRAATVNLFYVTNFLHDWFYDAGFDEASGNAQALNFGRGGLEGDSLKVEAQDYSGRNNANMSTPADGSRPRMQMYIFNGVPLLRVNAPASVAGVQDTATASFGAMTFDVTGDVKILNPSGTTLGCEPFAENAFAGKIALIDRGTCGFSFKALQAQNAGAIAVIIANNAANQPAPGLGAGPEAAQVTVPVLAATLEAGNAWKTEVRNNGTTVNVLLKRGPSLDRDGTLDNDIIAHEWGHYISNRLIGNSNGLTNNQGRAMGEGWGDFHALLMMVREEDRNLPGNNQYQGVYAMAGYTSSGGANNGYYYGIRRVPMSTDMTKNALTLKHTANGTPLPTNHPMASANAVINSQVHNSGEVWATMLWECYASLLNAYPFQEAQDRMKQYLVAAYKATPNAPTYLEARDALLAVARANDPADYARFANAFAKRGAGFGAKVSDRDSQDHIGVVESFTAGNNLAVASVRLDDSRAGCDKDGVLDVGETGSLTVKVVNTGAGALPSFTTLVSASGATATLSFPSGNTVQVPSLQPGQSATVSVAVALTAVSGATPRAGLTLAFNEASLPLSSRSYAHDARVHYDVGFSASRTEDVEADKTAWTSTVVAGKPVWAQTGDATNRYFHVSNAASVADHTLTTPWLQVAPTGNFTFSFRHRFSFESTNAAAPWWDGGVVEISLDDLTWYDLFNDLGVNPGYTAYLAVSDSPLSDRPAFVGLSTGFPNWVTRTVNLGTQVAGQKVRLRFRMGADGGVGAYGWDLDDITFNNILNTPFNTRGTETSDGSVCNLRPVAIVGGNQSVAEGTLLASGALVRNVVKLEGGSSFDPDGQALSYQWTQLSGPPVALSSTSVASPTFVADVASDSILSFQLVVSDGVDVSEPKQVLVGITNVNRPPVAVAMGPGTVAENSAAVVLDGTASSDADGEPLSFQWTQVAGPLVGLENPTSPTPGFMAPLVTADTVLEFQLVVSDGLAASAPVTVEVLITNVDMPPYANAGWDRTVPSRQLVMLRGMGGDPDGDALSYQWNQVSGPPVQLEGLDTPNLVFIAPSVGMPTDLGFSLTVTANGLQATDTVIVTVQSEFMPSVDAGMDQTVPGRRTVVQRGHVFVPSGAIPTYSWTQLMGPPVMLEGMNTSTLSFTSPDVKQDTTLVFELTVMANGLQSSDTVAINVLADSAPVANAGTDRTVASRSTVLLRGSAMDLDGDMVFFGWTQMVGPSTPAVVLENADTATPVFTAPSVTQPTELVFRLNVFANGLYSEDFVTITVAPEGMPTADAGEDQTVAGGRTVVLRGSASTPNGGLVHYGWSQVSGPSVTLQGANTHAATFTAPDMKMNTPLVFELFVMANGQYATDQVTVTVSADREPVADAGENRTVAGRKMVVLRGSATDADGDVATFSWTQLMGPAVVLEGANTAAPAFTTPDVKVDTTLVFQLTATAKGLSSTDTVALTVTADKAPVANAGSDRTVASRGTVVLRGSYEDEEGDAATYAWTQVSGPAVILSSNNTATPTFTAPSVTAASTLVFELSVMANGLQATDTVVITVAAEGMPTVDAGEDRTVPGRGLVVLRGTGSTPDGSAATYTWTQVSGQSVTLMGGNTAVASFTAPDVKSATPLVFQLTATANGQQATDMVVINVAADGAPVANAGSDRTVGSRRGVVLRGSATDAEGDAASFLWTQTGGPAVELAHADSATPSFTAPSVLTATQLEFSLTVTANGLQSSDTVVITVAAEGMPTVEAGEDRTVPGRGLVVLRGTGSTPDGSAATYAWTQVSGQPVTLTGGNTAVASFTAPDVKQATPLVFQLTATANGQQVSDTVALTVAADRAPVPNAGTDRMVGSRRGVVLRGSATDADGDALSYAWAQTGGPDVTLEHGDSATPAFTAPSVLADTALTFVLTVTANGLQATDTVVITVAAEGTPTADAGEDQAAAGGTTVVLRGTASSEGGVMAYSWSQLSGPSVTLTGARTSAASFTAPFVKADTALVFQLTVTVNGKEATDTVLVTVSKSNRRPVAQGPNALTENERTLLTLDAEGNDADEDSLTFLWEQVGGPRVTLEGATTARLSFTTPEVSADTLVAFRLLVTDADGAKSEAVTVSITVKNVNRSPVSKPRKVAGALGGQTVTLDASTSTDPDGESLTYQWAQVSGAPVSLSSSTEAVVTFAAPSSTSAQTFVFELTVSDKDGLSSKEQVSVELGPTPAQPQNPGNGNGGGCSSTGGSGTGALLLLLAGLVLSRRRLSAR